MLSKVRVKERRKLRSSIPGEGIMPLRFTFGIKGSRSKEGVVGSKWCTQGSLTRMGHGGSTGKKGPREHRNGSWSRGSSSAGFVRTELVESFDGGPLYLRKRELCRTYRRYSIIARKLQE